MVAETAPAKPLAPIDEALKASNKERRQFYWRKVYEAGKDETGRDLYPYSKEKPEVDYKPFDEALDEAQKDFGKFLKNFGTHLRKVDTGIRGRDAGSVGERLHREAMLLMTLATVSAYDFTTGRLFSKALKAAFVRNIEDPNEKKRVLDAITSRKPTAHDNDPRIAEYEALRKLISVTNDKYPAGFLNWWVAHATGVKRPDFVREASDRIGDAGNIILSNPFEDMLNGAIAECFMRMMYQIPVGGAYLERAWTKLTSFIEASTLRKSTAKAVFRSIAVGISYAPDLYAWKQSYNPNDKFTEKNGRNPAA